jgi:hypothetical protein
VHAGCGNDAELCVRDSDCEERLLQGRWHVRHGVGHRRDARDGTPGDGAMCARRTTMARSPAMEVPLAAGKMANFRIATDATFDTTGVSNGDGTRTWNLDVQLGGDTDRPLTLAAPTGQWWASAFPTATYSAPLSVGSDLVGVFHVDADAVTLLGVVSPDAGAFRTELEYDPPAKILALPFQAGTTWSSTSTISGTAQGAITAYTENYSALVDQVGTMTTPYGEFPVVRVATDLERTAGLATLATTRTFAWVTECFGSVANATSQDFESASEFNDPAEVRRLAP